MTSAVSENDIDTLVRASVELRLRYTKTILRIPCWDTSIIVPGNKVATYAEHRAKYATEMLDAVNKYIQRIRATVHTLAQQEQIDATSLRMFPGIVGSVRAELADKTIASLEKFRNIIHLDIETQWRDAKPRMMWEIINLDREWFVQKNNSQSIPVLTTAEHDILCNLMSASPRAVPDEIRNLVTEYTHRHGHGHLLSRSTGPFHVATCDTPNTPSAISAAAVTTTTTTATTNATLAATTDTELAPFLDIVRREFVVNPAVIEETRGTICGMDDIFKEFDDVFKVRLLLPGMQLGKNSPDKNGKNNMLLFGPPGTGKTSVALTLAASIGDIAVMNVDVSTVTGKYFGDSEKMIRAIFTVADEIAQNNGTLIIFDEIDTLFPTRSAGGASGSNNDTINRMSAQFLLELDGASARIREHKKPRIVVGATNHPWNLEEATKRRFSKMYYIGLPGAALRAEILSRLLDTERHLVTSSYITGAFVADTKMFSAALINRIINIVKQNQIEAMAKNDARYRRVAIHAIDEIVEPVDCKLAGLVATKKINTVVGNKQLAERYEYSNHEITEAANAASVLHATSRDNCDDDDNDDDTIDDCDVSETVPGLSNEHRILTQKEEEKYTVRWHEMTIEQKRAVLPAIITQQDIERVLASGQVRPTTTHADLQKYTDYADKFDTRRIKTWQGVETVEYVHEHVRAQQQQQQQVTENALREMNHVRELLSSFQQHPSTLPTPTPTLVTSAEYVSTRSRENSSESVPSITVVAEQQDTNTMDNDTDLQ